MTSREPSRLRLLVPIVLLAMVAAACTGGASAETTTTSEVESGHVTTTAAEEPDEATPATLRIGLVGTITTDNWWASLDTQDEPPNRAVLSDSKPTLFSLSLPGFVLVPNVAATENPVAPVRDGDLWVVEQPMREDVVWSDGSPVTAHDLASYFETVRDLRLGGDHVSNIGPNVADITAVDDHTVRIEFSVEPGLAVWPKGVGLAPFPPSHWWSEQADAGREAADEARRGMTREAATAEMVDEANSNDDPDDDLTAADVSESQIDEYIADESAAQGRSVLYGVSGVDEPSAGPLILERWERGRGAVMIANPEYFDSGTEKTLYDNGAFRVANGERGEDQVYGGEATGEVLGHYVDGPFVGEIQWIEQPTRDDAYEALANGALDFVYDPAGLTAGLRDELSANPDIRFSTSQTEGLRYLAFNLRKAPMSDVIFRRAVATVIDKEQIAETALGGDVFPAYTLVHPGLTLHYNLDVERPGWEEGQPLEEGARYERAIQLLSDVGYTWSTEPAVARDEEGDFLEVNPRGEGLTMPNGERVPDLTLLTPGPSYDPFRATFATHIEAAMQSLGIPVTAEQTDFDSIVAATFPPQTPESALGWDMYVLGWGAADPLLPGTATRAFFHSDQDAVAGGGFNIPGYRSAEFDEVADAFDVSTDLETAARLTRQMDAILARDLPYVVLFRTPIIEAFRRSVHFPVETIMGGHQGYPNAWPAAVTLSE